MIFFLDSSVFPFQNTLACVASVAVRFRSKERGTRVKDGARKMGRVKERGGGREETQNPFLGLSLLPN